MDYYDITSHDYHDMEFMISPNPKLCACRVCGNQFTSKALSQCFHLRFTPRNHCMEVYPTYFILLVAMYTFGNRSCPLEYLPNKVIFTQEIYECNSFIHGTKNKFVNFPQLQCLCQNFQKQFVNNIVHFTILLMKY